MSAESPKPSSNGPALPGAREVLVAATLFALLFAWPLRDALTDADEVSLGVDNGSIQLPWSAVLPPTPEGVVRPRNPALWDPGIGFYPLYLWMVRRWEAGETVRWNPLIFTGAPALGNPQQGVLDPQVWLLGLAHRFGGLRAFHWALGGTAWLRLVLAGLGAYLLARALALSRAGAALAGVTFGLSGFQVLWLHYSLGHVVPFLPWLLLALEGLRGPRPLGFVVLGAVALALSVLGGHPETAFFVGAAAGVWALGLALRDPRAGVLGLGSLALGTALSACGWLPFLEYLEASVAQAEREAVLTRGGVDLIALGALVVLVGVFLNARRELDREPGRGPLTSSVALFGFLIAVLGCSWLLRSRGLSPGAVVQLVHDFFGAPGRPGGGYRGPTVLNEQASGWVASGALTLALASALGSRPALHRRGLVLAVGAVALGLALELPGLHDLYRQLPVVGLGQTARLGAVSALMLGLLAGDGLTAAPRVGRVTSVVVLALGITAAYRGSTPPELEGPRPVGESDELVGFVLTPPDRLANRTPVIEGWLAPELPVRRARLVVERLDDRGRVLPGTRSTIPFELAPTASPRALERRPELVAQAPDGARFFRTQYFLVDRYEEGNWLLSVELLGGATADEVLGRRVLRAVTIHRPPAASARTLWLIGLGLGLVLLLPAGSAWRWTLVVVVALQALGFAEGKNPTTPLAEVYPPTRTVEILRRELGDHRFFAEPGVMPPDTGVAFDLRALDGYDGLRPFLYDAYKRYALKPGVHPLLGWNARGAELSSGVFRMMGASMLVLKSPLEEEGWQLVASPEPDAGVEHAETWIYRATDPLPRAFCVPRVLSIEELAATYRDWDPRESAALEAAWRPVRPFQRAEVTELEFEAERVSLRAELDGDGLLVLAEGAFPGWEVTVDGEERPLLNANMAFRSVPLSAGVHEVVFRYRSPAARTGFGVTAVAGTALLLLLAAAIVQKSRRGSASSASRSSA